MSKIGQYKSILHAVEKKLSKFFMLFEVVLCDFKLFSSKKIFWEIFAIFHNFVMLIIFTGYYLLSKKLEIFLTCSKLYQVNLSTFRQFFSETSKKISTKHYILIIQIVIHSYISNNIYIYINFSLTEISENLIISMYKYDLEFTKYVESSFSPNYVLNDVFRQF